MTEELLQAEYLSVRPSGYPCLAAGPTLSRKASDDIIGCIVCRQRSQRMGHLKPGSASSLVAAKCWQHTAGPKTEEAFAKVAAEMKISRADVIRLAVREWLEERQNLPAKVVGLE